MALITVALVLVQIMAVYQSTSLRLLLWPATLLVIGLHLHPAQRAARPEILQQAAQPGGHHTNHPKD